MRTIAVVLSVTIFVPIPPIRMRRNIMATLVLLSLIVSLTAGLVPASAANGPFSDVEPNATYAKAIGALKSDNILQGYADGTFKPDATINRAELLKIILEARGNNAAISGSRCFPDVQNQWFSRYVCTAKMEGIVSGYDDGLFRPDKPVNFTEASKIFSLTFKQPIQNQGGDWYVPYVEALDTSKAIPTSINGLTKDLSRGEMAEMMWRLTKGITDQPSKGYLNVKYPDVTVNLSSDTVQSAKSCADLQAFAVEARSGGRGYGGGIMMEDKVMMPQGMMRNEAAPEAAPTSGGAANLEYSHTNVQVEGVDEADVVKTDGTYLYIVSNGMVRIVKARPASDMKEVSTVLDSDSTFSPQELYINGNKLIIIGNAWRKGDGPIHIMGRASPMIMPPYWNPGLAQVRIFDVTDKTKPTLERKVSFEGSSVSTRLIGNKLYFIVNQPMRWMERPVPNPDAADILPLFEDSARGTDSIPVAKCADVSILPHVPSPQYLTVAVINTANATSDVMRETVLGNAQNVYASLTNLYVSTFQQIYYWGPIKNESGIRAPDENTERTNVYRFAFTDDGIALKAQGSVPGHLLNQFSMDENGTTFRVATTVNQAWDSSKQSSNNLYVLNQDLETVGKIEDIALGEQIYSIRFMGNRAYMVTFKTVDPLFVIDTTNPRNPVILGKLKIPGYSNYLHPFDETHIIGFGKDVDESIDKDKVHSNDAVYYTAVQGMKMALFDVSDVNNPKEMYKEVIGDRGTDSPLLSNHKALLFEKETGLLAFPITVYTRPPNSSASAEGLPTFQGAYVYKLSLDSGFQLKGKISHYSEDAYTKAGNWWYDYGKDVQRILRIAQSLLTVSNGEVRSTSLGTLQKEGSVEFSDISTTPQPCGDFAPCAAPLRTE